VPPNGAAWWSTSATAAASRPCTAGAAPSTPACSPPPASGSARSASCWTRSAGTSRAFGAWAIVSSRSHDWPSCACGRAVPRRPPACSRGTRSSPRRACPSCGYGCCAASSARPPT
jgi:hypothetical protein